MRNLENRITALEKLVANPSGPPFAYVHWQVTRPGTTPEPIGYKSELNDGRTLLSAAGETVGEFAERIRGEDAAAKPETVYWIIDILPENSK